MTGRVVSALLTALAVTVLWACVESSPQTHRYRLEVTISGSTGTDLTTTLRNESTNTVLATDSGVTAPRSYVVTGDVDYGSPRVVSVSAVVTALAAGASFSVRAMYIDESYGEPLSLTVIQAERKNTTGTTNDYSITEDIVMPYSP